MPRRNAKPVDPIEMGEQHGRCNWEGLRDQGRRLCCFDCYLSGCCMRLSLSAHLS